MRRKYDKISGFKLKKNGHVISTTADSSLDKYTDWAATGLILGNFCISLILTESI
jgi:hypothetical protein